MLRLGPNLNVELLQFDADQQQRKVRAILTWGLDTSRSSGTTSVPQRSR
jgi:hypothetical protein